MPKLPTNSFIYISAFFFLLLLGVAVIYFLSQNGGLNLNPDNKKQKAIETSNVLDDPQTTLFASCTHENMPFVRVSKGVEQTEFDAVATYSNSSDLANPIQVDIPAGKPYVDIELPTAKVKSQQVYAKLTYKIEGRESTDDVFQVRVDPCNVEYKNVD